MIAPLSVRGKRYGMVPAPVIWSSAAETVFKLRDDSAFVVDDELRTTSNFCSVASKRSWLSDSIFSVPFLWLSKIVAN